MEAFVEEQETVDAAEAKIEMIRQQVGLMGANDYEIPAINNLIERLRAGECTPEDAVKEAEGIFSSKQDYH